MLRRATVKEPPDLVRGQGPRLALGAAISRFMGTTSGLGLPSTPVPARGTALGPRLYEPLAASLRRTLRARHAPAPPNADASSAMRSSSYRTTRPTAAGASGTQRVASIFAHATRNDCRNGRNERSPTSTARHASGWISGSDAPSSTPAATTRTPPSRNASGRRRPTWSNTGGAQVPSHGSSDPRTTSCPSSNAPTETPSPRSSRLSRYMHCLGNVIELVAAVTTASIALRDSPSCRHVGGSSEVGAPGDSSACDLTSV